LKQKLVSVQTKVEKQNKNRGWVHCPAIKKLMTEENYLSRISDKMFDKIKVS
jgi:hypothetical protein